MIANKRQWQRFSALAIAGLTLLLVLPLGLASLSPLRFNQAFIERIEIQRGGQRWLYASAALQSMWSRGLNIIKGQGQWRQPPLQEPEAVLRYIFSWLPDQARVYPTEAFYYYSFQRGDYAVWGNLGTAALQQGRLDLAYFTHPETKTEIHSFGAAEGVQVTRLSEHVYAVHYAGRTVIFRQNPWAAQPPRQLRMAPDEEFVGRVYDESGERFFLFYDKALWTFYYVLDEEDGLSEPLQNLPGGLEVGERTGFVYVRDAEWQRRILTGVHLDNIAKNNFFDGPCDQVPFKADLRNKLHHAYPNALLGDGVDAHGVWQNKPQWERLAICAFRQYKTVPELLVHVQSCERHAAGSQRWDCLSREWWNSDFWRRMMLQRLLSEGKQPPLKPEEKSLLLSAHGAPRL